MGAIPRLHDWPERLTTIEGAPPQLTGKIVGCPFAPRCRYRIDRCTAEMPPLVELAPGHQGACWVAQAGGIDG
jgi:oligopeptide/dipeptide ABC transporter ATP-binding protein